MQDVEPALTKRRAGIVGYRGYSGMELRRILTAHPRMMPVLMEHRAESVPEVRTMGWDGPPRIPATPEAARQAGVELVFLATPAEASMDLAPAFLDSGIRVVDLSGAFRLGTVARYERWYKEKHTRPALLAEAVYGLPEFYRGGIPAARLVANPGCYPTAANLALRPLVEAGCIDCACGIICDAKSGASGAGRKPSLKTSYCEVTENFSAYSILGHRHVPEILLNSNLDEREFSFTAHLIPAFRGILETIYFRATRLSSAEDLVNVYLNAYRGEPFVRILPDGAVPDLRGVQHTNLCLIGARLDASTARAVVVVCIDNLGKGAAGQAVQNMNLMLGFDETEGLL